MKKKITALILSVIMIFSCGAIPASAADIGIAGGVHEGLLFSHGEIIGKVPEDQIIDVLIDKIKKI